MNLGALLSSTLRRRPAQVPGRRPPSRRPLRATGARLGRAVRAIDPVALMRRARDLSERRDDAAFLPAHLEILESPPSPGLVALTWTICLLLGAALVGACLGRLDIQAVAAGRVQLVGRSKVVQPLETGRVTAIHVADGARVNAGDPLVDLDAAEAEADLTAQRDHVAALDAQVSRHRAVIAAIETGEARPPAFPEGLPAIARERETSASAADIREFLAAREALVAQGAEIAAREARFAASLAARERLHATLKERLGMRESLMARGVGSRASVLETAQQSEQAAADVAHDRGQLEEARAGAVSLLRKVTQLAAETIARQQDKLVDAARRREALVPEVLKAALRRETRRITAPIAGTVQQLAVTSRGQVAVTAQPLLVIVPFEGGIEVEALVPSRDIGFVEAGQAAVVKVDAFPFNRYGTLSGTITRVSRDAVDAREASAAADVASGAGRQGSSAADALLHTQNLVFPVTITLERTSLAAERGPIPLKPGMTATVEIRTGSRRIIDYVLGPVTEAAASVGHER
jgi:hemolysin D